MSNAVSERSQIGQSMLCFQPFNLDLSSCLKVEISELPWNLNRWNVFPIRELLCIFDKTHYLRVIAKKILREFWTKYTDCEQQLKSWYREAEKSEWRNTHEIKKVYPTASVLGDNRVVFNIKGNNYRLIVRINFHYQMMWIRFVGTHKEYDRIDATKI